MFRVQDLLELPSFLDAAVVAGSSGLDRIVGDLSVMEVPDIESYVRPGGFLLTTLYPFSGQPDSLEHLILRLDAAQLSGIGVKLNRYVPDIPPACLEQADRLGFPLVILPADSDFSLHINEYLSACIRENNKELEHRNYVHGKMMEILLRGGNLGDLARILSGILHRTILLIDQDFSCMASHPARRADAPLLEALRRTCRESTAEFQITRLPDCCIAVYPVRYSSENIGYITVWEPEPFELSRLEQITLQQFAIVFRVIIQHNIMVENQEYRNQELFFCDLIYSAVSEQETAAARAKMLKWRLSFPLSILILQISNNASGLRERQNLIRLLREKIEWEFFPGAPLSNTFWVEIQSSIAVALNSEALAVCDRAADRIAEILRESGMDGFYMTLSREASSLSDIPKCYREARYTLELAQQMKRHGLIKFRDLGIYRIISSIQNQQDLWDFCTDTIGPLVEHDRRHNSDLVRTLETVIDHGGNLKAAAADLFIHYNTIRYRFRLIEKIFKKELSDPATYQNVSLALKVYRFLSTE